MKDRNKRKLIIYGLLGVLMLTTVAYASLQTILNVSGTVVKKGNLWNIYFTNPSSASIVGTATGGSLNIQASKLDFSVSLYKPSDKVTYTVDIKNGGTIDAVLNSISLTGLDTAKSNSLNYTVTYSNGSTIKEGDTLNIGASGTIKITVEFDSNATSIPESDVNLTFGVTLIYGQSTSSSSTGTSGITSNNVIAGIYGESIQNGTPTPTSPVEIESVGDKTKNLLNASLWKTSVTNNGITVEYLEDEDCFLLNGTATTAIDFAAKYINIPNVPGTSYVLSAKYVSGSIDRTNGSGNKYAVAYLGNADTINTTNNWHSIHLQNQDVTGSVKVNNKNYITRFWFYVSLGVKFDNYKVKIQLEEGNVATSYEPYGYKIPITVSNGSDTKTTNIYLKEPLRKVGEYADYLDLTNKKVVRNVKELILNGTENWTKYTSVNNHYQLIVGDNYFSRDTNSILSNYYIQGVSGSYNSSLNYAVISADANRIRFKDKDISTIEDWKNKLVGYADSNKPLKVIYQLANETEESVEIPSIPNLTGNITYSIDTTIKPSSINYSTK